MADETTKPEEAQKDPMVDVLVLRLDRRTMQLTCNGDVWERIASHDETGFDIAFNMLAQATRQLDVTYRIVNAMKAQQQMKQMQDDAALRARLAGRGQN